MKRAVSHWISATGVLLFGLASCVWAISQWRVQDFRSRQFTQEHLLKIQGQRLKERTLDEKRERQVQLEEEKEQQKREEATQQLRSECQAKAREWGDIALQIAMKVGTDGKWSPQNEYQKTYQECLHRVGLEN